MPKPAQDPKPNLADIAYEAEQQAGRIQALVQALALAHQDTDIELQFESVAQLLEPLVSWTSTLCWELSHQPPDPGEEPRP